MSTGIFFTYIISSICLNVIASFISFSNALESLSNTKTSLFLFSNIAVFPILHLACSAASILKKVFGSYHIYRFGGDEFIVIKNNTTIEEVRECFKLLDLELEKFNEKEHSYKAPLSLAKGAAEFDPTEDDEYLDTFKKADRAMYIDKNLYYEKHGGKQRR